MSRADDKPSGPADTPLQGPVPTKETMPEKIETDVILCNRRGLHARASAKFCAVASAWEARVHVSKDGFTVGGCSIMGLLTLGAGVGEPITISASGSQASEAVDALLRLVEDRFGEKE